MESMLWDGSQHSTELIKKHFYSDVIVKDGLLIVIREDRELIVKKYDWLVKNTLGDIYVCSKENKEYLFKKWNK